MRWWIITGIIFGIVLLVGAAILIEPRVEEIIRLATTGPELLAGFLELATFTEGSLSGGVFNLTQALGTPANVSLQGGETDGNYWSAIIDLNQTYTITNISYTSNEPPGTDIALYVRTMNRSLDNLNVGLQAWWNFEGGSGKDFSIFNNTCVVTGATPSIGGAMDNAFTFDGNDDLNCGDDDSVDFGNEDLTIAMWIKSPDLDGNPQMSAWWKGQWNNAPVFKIAWATYIRLWWDGGTRNSPSSLPVDTWIHTVAVLDRSSSDPPILYVDGVESTGGSSGAMDSIADMTNAYDFYIGRSDSYYWVGEIDEVAIWNRTLSQAEVTAIYTSGVANWSAWSAACTTSPCDITVDNGQFVQVRADFTRPGGENVHLDDIRVGYQAPGAPPPVDNPPETTLNTPDGQPFSIANVTLNCSATDDHNIDNISIYTNSSDGTWRLNETLDLTGTNEISYSYIFEINNTEDGGYTWNCETCDNATITQCAFAPLNKTYTVSTACIDSTCFPYVCNIVTQACYTTCTSHGHVNQSSYCAGDGTAQPAQLDTTDCAFKEWTGLTDDEVCTNQSAGFCFDDNIPPVGEYCTGDATGCVSAGSEYSQSDYLCSQGDGNDARQCLGGESAWSSLITCRNLGEDYDASATVSGHTYCGFYNAETCSSGSGCTPAVPATQDCGVYYYTGVSCGSTEADCDVGCGAVYDEETCNVGAGWDLNPDCTTCTPPAEDNPPEVSLANPPDASTSTSLAVDFEYRVLEDFKILNCSLWHNASGTWHLNLSNTSLVNIDESINTLSTTFADGVNMTWNVNCYDNNTQQDWGDNRTLSILFGIPTEKLEFAIYNESYNSSATEVNKLFSVDEVGNVYIKNDLEVEGNVSNLSISRLTVTTYFDLIASTLIGVRTTIPYDHYIKFESKNLNGNLLIGLFENNPLITTESGAQINFGKDISITGDVAAVNADFSGDVDVTGDLSVSGTSALTGNLELTGDINITGDLGVADIINPLQDTDIGGQFGIGNGGVRIDTFGNMFLDGNITFEGGVLTAGTSQYNASIVPTADDTYDVGNVTNRWRFGFFFDVINSSDGEIWAGGSGENTFLGGINVGSASGVGAGDINISDDLFVSSDAYIYNGLNLGTATGAGAGDLHYSTQLKDINVESNDATVSAYFKTIGTTPNHAIRIEDSGDAESWFIGVATDGTLEFSDSSDTIAAISFVDTFNRILFQENAANHGYIQVTSGGKMILFAEDGSTPDMELRTELFDNAIFIDDSTQRVGIGDATPSTTLDVTGGIRASGNLNVVGTITGGDYATIATGNTQNINIPDGYLCVEDLGGTDCSGNTDGVVYADDFVEHTNFWDVNVFGSALDEILGHSGSVVGENAVIDYETFNYPLKRVGYSFPDEILYLGETFNNETNITTPIYEDFSDITEEEFYNSLSVEDKDKVILSYGISVGGRAAQNEYAIVELYTENEILKEELCERDNSFSWCIK